MTWHDYWLPTGLYTEGGRSSLLRFLAAKRMLPPAGARPAVEHAAAGLAGIAAAQRVFNLRVPPYPPVSWLQWWAHRGGTLTLTPDAPP